MAAELRSMDGDALGVGPLKPSPIEKEEKLVMLSFFIDGGLHIFEEMQPTSRYEKKVRLPRLAPKLALLPPAVVAVDVPLAAAVEVMRWEEEARRALMTEARSSEAERKP